MNIYKHTIIKQVKYDCLYVYIIMTSRQKLLNGVESIFTKIVS